MNILRLSLVALTLALTSPAAAEKPLQLIAGAGPSTQVTAAFAELLAQTEAGSGYTIEVPPKSIKHAGGIQSADKYLLGRTGRPLTDEERATGVDEIWLARMPVAFVAGEGAGVSKVTTDQLCGLFAGKITNWSQVGGADAEVTVFTREPGEALFLALKKDLACMNEVVDTRYVFKKDDQLVASLLESDFGRTAVGFGARENFPAERLLEVEGFVSGVNLGLVYRTANVGDPLIQAARGLAGSQEWGKVLDRMGLARPSQQ